MPAPLPASEDDAPSPFPRPRPLRVPRKIELPDYLPARMLNEYVYCPRLFFYEWVESVFTHSADTVGGGLRHEGMDAKTDPLPPADELTDGHTEARSVTLSSESHRLIAKIDLIEGADGAVVPVDYKYGSPRGGETGPEAWPADRAQVCAQALVLRDNGYACDEAVVYYHATKQRVRVAIDASLVEQTLQALTDARRTAEKGRIPPPLVDSPKCPRCSLVGICLPDETAAASAWLQASADQEQLSLFEKPSLPPPAPLERPADVELRRLVPARDDLRPLYVTGYGMTVGKSGEVLQIREKKALVQEARINAISAVNLFGNVHLTASAIEALCFAEKPIAHFSFGGWFYGLTQGLGLKNVYLRRDQFDRAADPDFCIDVAREFVASKIRNQRTLLQRNHIEPSARALKQLKAHAASAAACTEMDRLLGLEGTAARVYFEQFQGLLKADDGLGVMGFSFEHRNRRPPRDPVNAMLSLAYSFLTRDFTIVCHTIGFDPFMGFYHQLRFGRPALALDLMEEFRPLVADSVVITAINGRMVAPDDFISAGGSVTLSKRGRTGLIRAYEQRMDTLVTHPLFGYRVSYRRVLEIQARLLARVVMGEVRRYVGFETR
ncbi:MAG: CRISPR-associated endonuclease Cas1 [Acidobacteria bacterium]|nr:CRISPR-associated endonuclease Cas1 [Acidobacteriota bacterium]